MKIVFVHGAQEQKMDASQLQDYWLNIFQLGLNHSAKHIELDTPDISFPYYGDLLFKHMLSFSTEPINLLGDTWQEWHLPFLLPDESQPVDDSHRSFHSHPTPTKNFHLLQNFIFFHI